MKTKIHVYWRDSINTDEIIPARYLNTYDEKELAKHAMKDLDIDFVKRVQDGDFLIVGKDFGCGSSREHAIWALRGAGVKGIIAKSFSRIFYRNAINNGFLAIECKEIDDKLNTGDEIEIDLDNGYFISSPRRSPLTRDCGGALKDYFVHTPQSFGERLPRVASATSPKLPVARKLWRSVKKSEYKYNFSPIPEFVKNIMEKGGLLNTIN